MVKGSSIGVRQPQVPLLRRTYTVVDDPSTDSIISWSQSGKSFIVWNRTEFCRDLVRECCGISHFSTFTMMLTRYGFRKVYSPDHQLWEFENDDFVKGEPERVGNIIKRPGSDRVFRYGKNTKMSIRKMKKKEMDKKVAEALTDQLQSLKM